MTDAETAPAPLNPPPARSRRAIILIAVAVVLVLGIAIYFFSQRNIETTDDAQVDGNAVSVAPKVSGYVSELAVHDNQLVKAGDLLLKIDPRDYIAARDQELAGVALAKAELENARVNLKMVRITAPAKRLQAKAQLAQAEANRALAAADYARQTALDVRATTQQAKDQASSQLRSADANLENGKAQLDIASLIPETIEQAQAQVDQAAARLQQAQAVLLAAELNITYTELRAPQAGRVTMRNVQQGNYIQAGQSVLALVTSDVWITANFKENQLARMRVGQKVDVRLDAYGNLKLEGHVDSIQAGTGSRFSAFPAENATGNFVKIVQRVPVKIVIDRGLDPKVPLPLGASAVPTVHLQ
jgi:membrane fusion protein (multidrug efflux system)